MVFHGVIQIAANSWRAWLWRHHVKWSVVLKFGSGSAASLIVFSFFDFVPDKALVLMVVGLTPFAALPCHSASRPISSAAGRPSWRARSAGPCSSWPASPDPCWTSSMCAPA